MVTIDRLKALVVTLATLVAAARTGGDLRSVGRKTVAPIRGRCKRATSKTTRIVTSAPAATSTRIGRFDFMSMALTARAIEQRPCGWSTARPWHAQPGNATWHGKGMALAIAARKRVGAGDILRLGHGAFPLCWLCSLFIGMVAALAFAFHRPSKPRSGL